MKCLNSSVWVVFCLCALFAFGATPYGNAQVPGNVFTETSPDVTEFVPHGGTLTSCLIVSNASGGIVDMQSTMSSVFYDNGGYYNFFLISPLGVRLLLPLSTTVPSGSLTNFNGSDPNGTWCLEITEWASGTEMGQLNPWSITFTVTNGPCEYAISPTNSMSDYRAWTGSVAVINYTNCSWTASSTAGWITITSGSSGIGGGTVSYAVASNFSNSVARTGTLSIADKTFTVTQGAGPPGRLTRSMISAGNFHTVAVRMDGTVWDWGIWYATGTNINLYVPTQVNSLSNIVSVGAGPGDSFALALDGTMWMWGQGSYDPIGNTNTVIDTPIHISGLSNIIAVAGGVALKSDGTVFYIPLSPSTTQASAIQVDGLSDVVMLTDWIALKSDGTIWTLGTWTGTTQTGLPVQVNSLSNVFAIAGSSTALIADDESAWSWASVGSTPYQVTPALGMVAIATGGNHWLAIFSDTGDVMTWGANLYGELGDGTENDSTLPVQVEMISRYPLQGGVQVAAGAWHSVAYASDGRVWTWGINHDGELGRQSFNSDPNLDPYAAYVINIDGDVFNLNECVPLLPTGLVVTASSTNQISLAWQDNSDNEDAFIVQQATSSNGVWQTVAITGSNVTSSTVPWYYYPLLQLQPCTRYYYRVFATNSFGASPCSEIAIGITEPCATIPAPPSNLAAVAVSPSEIDLSWFDSASNAQGLTIEQKTGVTGTWQIIANISTNRTSYQNTALVANELFLYRVTAHNVAGDSPYSNEAQASTPCGYSLSPTNGIYSAAAGSGSVTVAASDGCAWTATSQDGWIVVTNGNTGTNNASVAYLLQVNATTNARSGTITISDQTFTVLQAGNAAPQVSIAPVAPVTLPITTVNLNATVTDDGAPYGTLNVTWSKVSGPGTANFGNTNAANTTATFSTNGMYVLQLLASDGALSTSNTVTVIVNAPPAISTPPAVTNAVGQVAGMTIVLAGQTNCFTVGVTDTDGNTPTCLWNFGDGTTGSDCNPCHVYTNCQPFTVTFSATDGIATNTTNFVVAVPCSVSVNNLQAKLNFAKLGMDTCKFKAVRQSSQCTSWLGTAVTLDVGDAQVVFTLDAKGRGVSTDGTCRFTYNKKTDLCTFTANLNHGSWQTPWAAHGLVNATILKPGTEVVLPVILVIGDNVFMDEKPLHYTATAGKSGTAR